MPSWLNRSSTVARREPSALEFLSFKFLFIDLAPGLPWFEHVDTRSKASWPFARLAPAIISTTPSYQLDATGSLACCGRMLNGPPSRARVGWFCLALAV